MIARGWVRGWWVSGRGRKRWVGLGGLGWGGMGWGVVRVERVGSEEGWRWGE